MDSNFIQHLDSDYDNLAEDLILSLLSIAHNDLFWCVSLGHFT